jgi:hypothetical protein
MRAALILLVLAVPASARADEGDGLLAATAESGGPRTGWMYGANIGRGRLDISCPGCGSMSPLNDALSIGGHVGKMVSPRLAVMLDVWVVRYHDRNNYWFGDSQDHLIEQRVATGAAQLWVSRRWWLRAGLGAGHHQSDADYTEAPMTSAGVRAAGGSSSPQPPSRVAMATALAAGVEIIHTRGLAIDLQLRSALSRGSGVDTQTTAVEFGVSWY